MATKHHQTLFGDQTDVELGGQTVKTCLIKHGFNSAISKELWATNYPAYLAQRRDSNMHGEMCDFAEFAIQRFKFKKSIAAITILDILEED